MSIALAVTLAASMTVPTCSWDRPGANPFMGDVVAAVDRYTDIPEPVRARLKARMETRQYDEIAAIRRDSVTGKRKYAPEIRDMHFGQGTVCRTVTRTKWADDTVERGLVYCERGHCIIVPTVCRNVSRIKRLGGDRVAAAGDESLLAPEVLVAGPGAGDAFGGGGGGGGLPGGSSAPLLALNTAPGAESAGGGGTGDGSFQSVSGLAAFSVSTLEISGSNMPLSTPPQSNTGDGGLPWTTGAGPDGFITGPLGGVGSIGSLVGGGNPGGSGTGDGGSGPSGPTGPSGDSDSFPAPAPPSGLAGVPNLSSNQPIRTSPIGDAPPLLSDVPEPGAWALLLLGLAGLSMAARRR